MIMKKQLLLLLLSSIFLSSCGVHEPTGSGNSKNEEYLTTTQTIVYDFKTKEYTKSMVKPRVREPLVLKIENINRLAYDVTIKSNDVAIVDENFKEEVKDASKKTEGETGKNESAVPKTFSETKFNTESLKVKPETVTDFDKEILDNQAKITQYVLDIKNKKDSQLKLLEEISYLQLKLETAKINNSAIDTIDQNALNNKLSEETNLRKEIESLQGNILAERNEIIKFAHTINALNETFIEFNKLYREILYSSQNMRIIDERYQIFRQSALNPLLKCETYKTFIEDPKFILYQLPQYRSQIDEFDKNINNFINFYNEAMNNWKIFDKIELAEAKENIRIKYQLYKEEVDKIKVSVEALGLPTKLRKVEAMHAILREKEAYEISSSPIQPLEDYVTFDVTIKNRDLSKSSEYDDTREFTYLEYTRGGVRFDFSTGVILNFIGNNDKYALVDVPPVDDVAMKKIVVTENNQFTPALAGMFHTSFRSCGIWAFGLTLGASVNVETFELNSLFPGVSLLIGKKQKFIISAGPAFRQVEELKANYRENGTYKSSDFTAETQLTSKQFRMGVFCGITYNLTQKQRAKFKIGTE
jgi:hypothetical protein